jgi:hypothetical protein
MTNHRQGKALAALVALLLSLGTLPALLQGCSSNEPTIHAIKGWDDVQPTIDGARSSDCIDLSSLTTPTMQYTLEIPLNFNLSFVGNKDVTYIGVAIQCEGGNVISITDLNLVSTNNQATSTLGFTGWGNQLIVTGENSIVNAQAADDIGFGAAIGVSDGTTLTIAGQGGTLTARGGSSAAGIGGGVGRSSGTLIIRESVVVAYGGDLGADSGGAGIGGGRGGSGGSLTVSSGSVFAFGGQGAAGIGGGFGGSGGKLIINGGSVYADGEGSGSGIGRGSGGEGITLNMSGGSLTAIGSASLSFDAIGGRIESLPGAYRWWAGMTSVIMESQESESPGKPFIDNGGYYFVRIETR